MTKVLLFDFYGVLFVDLKLNQKLLDYLAKIKKPACRQAGKYKLAILTSSKFLVNQPKIKQKLDQIFIKYFFSKDLQKSKEDPEIYLQVAEKLKVKPEEILFIDDWQQRTDAAKEAGLKTHLFNSNQELLEFLKTSVFISTSL